MPKVDARIALARLIEERIDELGVDRVDFVRDAGFIQKSTLTRYLRGYSKLPLSQLPDVVEALQLNERDERRVLLMCLAQSCVGPAMELIERNMRPDNFDVD